MGFTPDFWQNNLSIALIYKELSWSYHNLYTKAIQRSQRLKKLGVQSGHLVLTPADPVIDVIILQHALAHLKAALFPYYSDAKNIEVQELAKQTGAEWVWLPNSETLVATNYLIDKIEDNSISLLIQTSGSKGSPKIAMLTSINLLTSAYTVNKNLDLNQDDIWLSCMRFNHISGSTLTYRCALARATLLIHDRFDPIAVQQDLRNLPVTHLSVVPPMLARLLESNSTPPPSLRVLLVGGQACSKTLTQRALDAGWPVFLTYGMTETASQIATTEKLSSVALDPSLVGKPLPSFEIKAPACSEPLQPLQVRGSCVMAGYANSTRQFGLGLNNGWFTTSDLACLNKDGQLRLAGRSDEVRVIGGVNVSLTKIEALLQQVPGVNDLAIVALPEDIWGSQLIAIFTGATTETALQVWSNEYLSKAEQPRVFLHLSSFPFLSSGKYDRVKLNQLAQQNYR